MTISAIALRKTSTIFGANLQSSIEELKTTMDHNLQVLLAIGISAALCLVTWIWARRGRGGVFHGTDS